MPRKYLLLLAVSLSVILLDQWTKYAMVAELTTRFDGSADTGERLRLLYGEPPSQGFDSLHFRPARHIEVIPGYFRLRYAENPGAAWGLFGSLPRHIRGPLFHLVSLGAVLLIGVYFSKLGAHPREERWALVGLPLVLGGALVVMMWTWNRGAQILSEKTRRDSVSLLELADILKARAPHRAPGTAIFLTSDPDTAPVALMHNLKHNKVLHEKNIILTVQTAETPRVRDEDRVRIEPVNDDFKKVIIGYGFMESPNIPKALGLCRKQGLKFDIMATSFFLGRRSVVPSAQSGMPLWQDKLFIFLMKNAANPTDFFKIPPGRVVEMGTQVTV